MNPEQESNEDPLPLIRVNLDEIDLDIDSDEEEESLPDFVQDQTPTGPEFFLM